MNIGKYKLFLLVSFLATWVWSAVEPLYPDDWLLENYLVFLFVPIVLVSHRYLRLSALSYTSITIFMMLHVVGSHYTYSETPFGYILQQMVGAERNMYDRFVHFAYGLLLVYPARELFLYIARSKSFWSYHLPLDAVIASSAVYEIIEWSVAGQVDPAAGFAFLGAQGDIWDAQKDMLAAIVGATATLSLVATVNWRRNPNFRQEMTQSLRPIPGQKNTLRCRVVSRINF